MAQKNDRIPFRRLRKILLDLGFQEKEVPGPYWFFKHAPTDSILVYRHYQPEESVTWADQTKSRVLLEWKGLMEADDFEDLLQGREGCNGQTR